MKKFKKKTMVNSEIRSRNMSSLVGKKYVNKWVAISPDYKKILAVADSLSAVLKKSEKAEKIVMKVLPNLGYAPFVFR